MRNLKIAVAAAALCASLSACSGLGALTPGIDALKAIQKSSAPAPSPSVPPPPPRVQVRPTGELDHGNAAHVKAVAGLSQVSIVDDAAGPPRVMPDVAFIVARRPVGVRTGLLRRQGAGQPVPSGADQLPQSADGQAAPPEQGRRLRCECSPVEAGALVPRSTAPTASSGRRTTSALVGGPSVSSVRSAPPSRRSRARPTSTST
jgi:hypothetical protein